MAEILSKSKPLRLLAWGAVSAVPLTALIWKAADILAVVLG